jgi:CheY-like chemotaxis protein
MSDERRLVLIVDDDALVRETLMLQVQALDHDTAGCGSGAEALDLLRTARTEGVRLPDVVLTDMGMPGMTGLDLIAALRRDRWSMPCLLLSGSGPEIDEEDVYAAGGQGVLHKPLSIADLRERLAVVFGGG